MPVFGALCLPNRPFSDGMDGLVGGSAASAPAGGKPWRAQTETNRPERAEFQTSCGQEPVAKSPTSVPRTNRTNRTHRDIPDRDTQNAPDTPERTERRRREAPEASLHRRLPWTGHHLRLAPVGLPRCAADEVGLR